MASTRMLSGLLVAGSALVLTLTSCAGLSEQQSGNNSGGEGGGTEPGLAACAESPVDCNSAEVQDGGEITYLINQGHDGVFMDLTAAGNSVYLTQMMEGIYTDVGYFDPSGEWHYNMDLFAEEPELVSEDPLTVEYVIRDEAVWSDGEPIDLDDVEFQQKMMSGKAEDCTDCQPADSSFFDTTASIEADDSGKTITITYDDGFKHPEWFARQIFRMPAHIADAEGFDWRNDPDAAKEANDFFLNTAPTWASGPYVADSWTADESQVLVPNEEWYGETPPAMDTIVKQVVPDQPSWVPATENGELNGGAPASFTPDLQTQLSEIPGVTTSVAGSYSWDHVDMNMDSVDDPALRKAIFTAIDNEDARERIWGDLEELPPMRTGLFLPQASPYHQDHLTDTGYGSGDIEAAKSILEEAGYTGCEAGSGCTDPDGEPVGDLRFAFLAGNQNRDTFTQLAQSYLKEIGITVTPEATPEDQLGTVLTETDYDMVIFGWSGSPLIANAPFQFYNSESSSNFGRLDSKTVDDLTVEARNQIDLEATAEVEQEIIQEVLDEAYILPLWDTPNLMWVSDDYANMRDNGASASRTFYNVGEWGARVE